MKKKTKLGRRPIPVEQKRKCISVMLSPENYLYVEARGRQIIDKLVSDERAQDLAGTKVTSDDK